MEASEQQPAPNVRVAVYGAYGHTAKFVAAELVKRDLRPVLSGRDASKVEVAAADVGASEFHVAVVDDPASLDRAIDGCAVVVNCAGPFGESAPALIDAAARAQVHYIDLTGEILVALETFERFEEPFRGASHVVLPAFGFFGALGDLAATTLAGAWDAVEHVTLAVALDGWQPTHGTRLAGERRAGRRTPSSTANCTFVPRTTRSRPGIGTSRRRSDDRKSSASLRPSMSSRSRAT
jgi:Saccharopine dehydrogenase NADP binding domain